MYGSIFRMKPKPGQKDAVLKHVNDWSSVRSKQVKGYVANYLLETEDGDLIGCAVFADEEAYRANANDPEQDKWFQQLRVNLEGDPDWNDGTIHQWKA